MKLKLLSRFHCFPGHQLCLCEFAGFHGFDDTDFILPSCYIVLITAHSSMRKTVNIKCI